MSVSPHAIIDPKAEIASDVEIGPFCVIGPNVIVPKLGEQRYRYWGSARPIAGIARNFHVPAFAARR